MIINSLVKLDPFSTQPDSQVSSYDLNASRKQICVFFEYHLDTSQHQKSDMIINLLLKVAPVKRQLSHSLTYESILSTMPSVVTSAFAKKMISTVALTGSLSSLDQTLVVEPGLYGQNHT